MKFESPLQLLSRLKLGREEYCQRLLTSLILDGPYPPWNTRRTPGPAGLAFLRGLYELAFRDSWPGDRVVFVDEFELPPRHDRERGGAPDYAVLWAHRLWLIELKTERSSHRGAQIPTYFELARHHHPGQPVDLLYVTPPMGAPEETDSRYAHLRWAELAPLIRSTWSSPTAPGQQEVLDGLLDAIAQLNLAPATWRAELFAAWGEPLQGVAGGEPSLGGGPTTQPGLDGALALARQTASDGKQRSVDFRPTDLEELLELRLHVRDLLAASSEEPLRHVMPWIWRTESTGEALTAAGRELGMELRLSRYAKCRY